MIHFRYYIFFNIGEVVIQCASMFENINHGESNTYKAAKMFTRYVYLIVTLFIYINFITILTVNSRITFILIADMGNKRKIKLYSSEETDALCVCVCWLLCIKQNNNNNKRKRFKKRLI